jgi:hypothetical protein
VKQKIYNGEIVYIVKETDSYTVVSYNENGIGIKIVAKEKLFDSFEAYHKYKQENKSEPWQS